jgi:DNA repair photolyase
MAKKVLQEVTAKQAMNRVKEPRMPFDWSINPYRGCSHGCSFCYARTTHTFLGMEADDTFQNHILLKTNAAEALEAQLAKWAKRHQGDVEEVARQVGLVAIGTATDPYQPVEAKARIARECLKVLARYQIPTTITTRSPLILRDLDILREVPIASINISVNTLDNETYRRLEPATPHPMKRLETVQALVENGLPAGVFVAPILPYLTDSEEGLEQLTAAVKASGAQFAMPSVLRLTSGVKEWYFQVIGEHYPHLLPAYRRMYSKAYPSAGYIDALGKRVRGLLARFELPTDVPTRPQAKPRPAASAVERQPPAERVEQLSFSF